MQIKSTLILLALSATTLFSCSSETKEETNLNQETPIGSEIDNQVAKANAEDMRKFTVNEHFCKQTDMPIINFSLDYPEHLETDMARPNRKDYNYNAFFKKDDNGKQIENISLGYYIPANSGQMTGIDEITLLTQVGAVWSKMFDLKETSFRKRDFNGEEYYMLRSKGTISNPEQNPEFEGTYLIQSVLVEPKGGNENGLLVSFFANENSEIKTFDDFATKGDISTVWQTLTFK